MEKHHRRPRPPAILDDIPDPFAGVSTSAPILFLPFRIETRFGEPESGELLVRMYPDEVHVESFQPALVHDEEHAWRQYVTDSAGSADAARTAWKELARRVGAMRAAYIASLPPPTSPNDGGPPPRFDPQFRASLLPDKWLALVYHGVGPNGRPRRVSWKLGQPIPELLSVAPSVSPTDPPPPPFRRADELPIDQRTRWMVDFAEAERIGMALRVSLPEEARDRIDLLLVVGVRAGRPAESEAAALEAHFQAQHFSRGIGFVPPGTPTNNTPDVPSGHASREPSLDESFAIERGPALCKVGDGSSGDTASRALGISISAFEHVRSAAYRFSPRDSDSGYHMRRALWPATWGYFIDQMMAGPLPDDSLALAIRSHFVAHVSGRGALPSLRIGKQPYGLVIASSFDRMGPPPDATEHDAAILDFLRTLRASFRRSLAKIPRVGADGDPNPHQTLVSILAMSPVSASLVGRSVLGADYVDYLYNWLYPPKRAGAPRTIDVDWWKAQDAAAMAALESLGIQWPSTPRIQSTVQATKHFPIRGPRVQGGPLSETDELAKDILTHTNYIQDLISFTYTKTVAHEHVPTTLKPPAPRQTPLLYLLLRHAALQAYSFAATRLLPGEFAVRGEPEMVGIGDPTVSLKTAFERLESVGAQLEGFNKFSSPVPTYSDFWNSLLTLAELPTAELDRLLSETLDLCTHRLDAWLSAFAARRLWALRPDANRRRGIFLGGFGCVEDLRRRAPAPVVSPPPPGEEEGPPIHESTMRGGFVHGPSLAHATTAAVLRSGYLSHRTEANQPLAIDLSSDRVRRALWLIEGVRNGQPLGALLGYRFERALREAPEQWLGAFIPKIRPMAPLVAGKLTPFEGPLEAVAASNVVDGLVLLQKWRANRDHFWDAVTSNDPERAALERAALEREIGRIDDVVDALADLLLAEGVHQLALGNPARAGAALDAIGRGEALPSDLSVIRTPRTGKSATHRVLVLLPANPPAPDGWTQTLRAQAEPALEAWVAHLLGHPGRVSARVDYFAPGSGAPIASMPFTLADLELSALDVVLAASELEQRWVALAEQQRPPQLPPGSIAKVFLGRDPTWTPGTIGPSEIRALASAIAAVLSRARPATPEDLAIPGTVVPNDASRWTVEALEARLHHDVLASIVRDLRSSDPPTVRAGLVGAASLGVRGTFPERAERARAAQAEVALAEIAARAKKVAPINRHSPYAHRRDAAIRRLRALMGDGFPLLTPFNAPFPDMLGATFERSLALQDGDPLAVVTWLKRLGHVRAPLGGLDRALLLAETLAPADKPLDPALDLTVGQIPPGEHDRWIALETRPGWATVGNISLIVHRPLGFDLNQPMVGLFIDGWTEVVPSERETTGVAFQYDEPRARAPQAMLLAVPPDDAPEWTLDAVEATLVETLELAKFRAVDPDALEELGHYLPALYFAINLGNAIEPDKGKEEAFSTDFTIAGK